MKIILSPAKKMITDTDSIAPVGMPDFLDKTTKILSWMKSLEKEELKAIWKCNDKIARQNFDRLENMDLYHMLTPAILSYEGIAFQYMAPAVFEQGALTVMKKNFGLFIACLKELPEQNAAGMPLKVNGLDVQGSLFRDVDGKPVDGAVASLNRGRLKMTPERIAEAPDLLHFEKGIYCAFMKKGTVKGDIVLYETNFGVTLPTCGNQRTLTSFLGFKKCSLDGMVTLVDAPYRVYDNTVQYRRYLRSKAKREQAV